MKFLFIAYLTLSYRFTNIESSKRIDKERKWTRNKNISDEIESNYDCDVNPIRQVHSRNKTRLNKQNLSNNKEVTYKEKNNINCKGNYSNAKSIRSLSICNNESYSNKSDAKDEVDSCTHDLQDEKANVVISGTNDMKKNISIRNRNIIQDTAFVNQNDQIINKSMHFNRLLHEYKEKIEKLKELNKKNNKNNENNESIFRGVLCNKIITFEKNTSILQHFYNEKFYVFPGNFHNVSGNNEKLDKKLEKGFFDSLLINNKDKITEIRNKLKLHSNEINSQIKKSMKIINIYEEKLYENDNLHDAILSLYDRIYMFLHRKFLYYIFDFFVTIAIPRIKERSQPVNHIISTEENPIFNNLLKIINTTVVSLPDASKNIQLLIEIIKSSENKVIEYKTKNTDKKMSKNANLYFAKDFYDFFEKLEALDDCKKNSNLTKTFIASSMLVNADDVNPSYKKQVIAYDENHKNDLIDTQQEEKCEDIMKKYLNQSEIDKCEKNHNVINIEDSIKTVEIEKTSAIDEDAKDKGLSDVGMSDQGKNYVNEIFEESNSFYYLNLFRTNENNSTEDNIDIMIDLL